ncbi:MAG: hypothetical protein RJB22_646 [Pseudomonadota bacterium]|jgi:signal transduction histidine kinase
MFVNAQIENWTSLYLGELFAFSTTLAFVLKGKLWRQVLLWICSNATAAFGILLSPILLVIQGVVSPYKMGFLLSYISLLLAYLAVGSRAPLQLPTRKSLLLISASAPFAIYFLAAPFGWRSVILAYVGGIFVCLGTTLAAYRNRLWRGLWGQALLMTGSLLSAVLLVWRSWTIFAARSGDGFDMDPAISLASVQFLVANSFFLQIGFLGLIIERGFREQRLSDRRAARAFASNQALAEEQQQIAAIAEERLDMLQLLIHEVRQPINNAQAALQSLDYEVRQADLKTGGTSDAIARAQSVLDGITLAISNAILGASILGDSQNLVKQRANVVELAELAITDCPSESRHRIQLAAAQPVISADVDPILMRLALRNLLDNALKYSPANSPVHFAVSHDEARLGISFTTTNALRGADLLSDSIFERRRRGSGAKGDGSGLGLYLVREVAHLHHGDVSYELTPDQMVRFTLFIAV